MPTKKILLVVDDDKDLVFLVKKVMLQEGFEVLVAYDGLEALRVIKNNAPDAMVVDLIMPNMDGWHFTTLVRRDERFKSTPIVVLSALLESDAEPQAFESATAYMVKPFDVFKLIEKIKTLLQKATKGQPNS